MPLGKESECERNKRLVTKHFADFVNCKDLDAISCNMATQFPTHDGPRGKPPDPLGDLRWMEAPHREFSELRVNVRDVIAEGDKVMIRNCGSGTLSATGKTVEFHGFVLWRIKNGKIVERWAIVMPPRELIGLRFDW